jgi:hypothetical protein
MRRFAISFLVIGALFLSTLGGSAGCGGTSSEDSGSPSENNDPGTTTIEDFYNRWNVINLDIDCSEYPPDIHCSDYTTEPEGVLIKSVSFAVSANNDFRVTNGTWQSPEVIDTDENFFHSVYHIEEIANEIFDYQNHYEVNGNTLTLSASGSRFDPACYQAQRATGLYSEEVLKQNCTSEPFEDIRSFTIVSVSEQEILLQGEDGTNFRLVPDKAFSYKQYWR